MAAVRRRGRTPGDAVIRTDFALDTLLAAVSDPFDGDPDGFFEPDESETEYGEDRLDPEDPAAPYEEGTFDTSPSVPEAPTPDSPTEVGYEDVDPELRQLFWKLVIVVKFSLITLTLGALFVTLGNRPTLGRQFLAFGFVLVSYGVYQYRKSKSRIESEEFDPDEDRVAEREADSPTPSGEDGPVEHQGGES